MNNNDNDNSFDYYTNLENEIDDIEQKINFKSPYNIKNYIMRKIIKSGIKIEYLFPYILSGIIIFQITSILGNRPYIKDTIIEEEHKEMIKTSTGIKKEYTTYDKEYKEESIEYTSAWYKNEYDLYQRDILKFKMNDNIKIDKILSMNKEQLKQLLSITDKQTIYKEKLDEEDKIYNENMIIVTKNVYDNNTRKREETLSEVIENSMLITAIIVCSGLFLENIKDKTINTYFRDKLNKKLYEYRQITPEEIEELKKILKIKQDNLDYINNNIEKKHILHKEMM